MLTFWTIIEFTNYIYSSNTSLAEKRQKKKKFMLLAKLDSMTNPSVVKIVPHWPNLMGQIREQTFATLYATPPPLLLCSCSRDRSFRIDLLFCYVWDMAIPVVEFSREGYKIRKVVGWKSTVVKWNHWILQIGVMGRSQNVPKFNFQSQFSMSKIIRIFPIFFHWRIRI